MTFFFFDFRASLQLATGGRMSFPADGGSVSAAFPFESQSKPGIKMVDPGRRPQLFMVGIVPY